MVPAGLTRSSLAAFVQKMLKECRFDEAVDMAAQVSFYFALSCFPFLLVLAALIGWFHESSNWQSFWIWLTNYLPASTQSTVLTIVLHLSKGFKGFLSFGLAMTIWSASTGFLSLMDALSHVYGAQDTRSYLRRRSMAILATLLAAVFLVLSFGVWSGGHFLATAVLHMSQHFAKPWKLAGWAITLLVILIGVDLINYFFPAKRPRWRWIMPGSALTVICFVLASISLKLYATFNHSMSRVYGTLTGFIIMMLWIYLANLSVLLGAETDAVLTEMRDQRAGD